MSSSFEKKISRTFLLKKFQFISFHFFFAKNRKRKNECQKNKMNMSQCRDELGWPLLFSQQLGQIQDPVLKNGRVRPRTGHIYMTQSCNLHCVNYDWKKGGGKNPWFWVGTTCIQKCKFLPPRPPCLEASTVERINHMLWINMRQHWRFILFHKNLHCLYLRNFRSNSWNHKIKSFLKRRKQLKNVQAITDRFCSGNFNSVCKNIFCNHNACGVSAHSHPCLLHDRTLWLNWGFSFGVVFN